VSAVSRLLWSFLSSNFFAIATLVCAVAALFYLYQSDKVYETYIGAGVLIGAAALITAGIIKERMANKKEKFKNHP
jgi:hypothetical protein